MQTLTPVSLELIKTFASECPVPMMFFSEDGKIHALSRAWTESTGYTCEDLPDLRAWTRLAYREKADRMRTLIADHFKKSRAVKNFSMEIWCKDGTKKAFLLNAKPFISIADHPPLRWVTAVDISYRKKTGDALRESEQRFRELADAVPHLVWRADPDGNFDYYNKRTLEFLGETSEKMNDRTWYGAIHSEDLPRVAESWKISMVEGSEFFEEFRIRSSHDGRFYWHVSHGVPVKNSEGQVLRWYGTCTDIDARKKMDKALRQSERRLFLQANELETLYQTAPVGLCIVDREHRIQKINKLLANMKSFWAEETTAASPKLKIAAQIKPFIDKVFETGEPNLGCEISAEAEGLSNAVSWWLSSYSPIKDSFGRVQAVHCFVQDITHRKQAEMALMESERLFRQMADNAPVMIWITAPDGNCTYLNQQWYLFTGRPQGTGTGLDWLDSVHPDDRATAKNIFTASNSENKSFRCEYRLKRQDGSYRWVLDAAEPRRDDAGKFLGFIGSVTDVDDIKMAERRLAEMNQTLEHRVRMRTLRLEEQAGQLRQLAAQLTNVEQNERKRLAELIHDHLQQLLVATKIRVSLAIKDSFGRKAGADLTEAERLLDESISVSRSLTAELRPPVLYEDGLIPALKWLAKNMKKQYDIQVELELDEKSEPSGEQIKAMLYESARELMFNAVKYAKVGRIFLSLSRINDRLQLRVRDEGSGFDVQIIDRRTDSDKGFGLFSIRERLKAMGGDLNIVSKPGAGTLIDLLIPFIPENLSQDEQIEKEDSSVLPAGASRNSHLKRSRGISIIVADDHRIVREGIANLLMEQKGLRVIGQAGDGAEAVDLARALHPDIVIMDLNMPNLNGIEATRIITAELPAVKVIGLSVHSAEDVAESMQEAGAFTYLNKAGDPKKLIAAIMQAVPLRTA